MEDVGLYPGEVGLYSGDVGLYSGDVGLYAGGDKERFRGDPSSALCMAEI